MAPAPPDERAVRDARYEADFEVPAAPTVPRKERRQNVANQPVSHEWDAMELINTDRPDFTDVLPTVKKYMWQLESGYSFSLREGDDYTYQRHRGPESLIRYGLTERMELRVRWDSAWYTQRTGTVAGEPGIAFSSEMLVGFKWQAILQDGWLPAHSFMGTVMFRGAQGGPARTGVEPGLNWIYGWQVTKALVIRGSTGLEVVTIFPQRVGGSPEDAPFNPRTLNTIALHQSVVMYVQWIKRLGTYTEWFSFYDFGAERGNQHNVGQGFYIYITPNIQIDLRVVGTVFAQGDRFRDLTVGSGLSLRGFYHRKDKGHRLER